MAARSRDVLHMLFEKTELPVEAILGAYAILEKGGMPCNLRYLIAASFTAYKVYTTHACQLVSTFQARMLPSWTKTDIVADELRVLAAISNVVPWRTRMDCVRRVAGEVGAGAFDFDRAIILTLLLPECDTMDDDLYARAVLYAAVHLLREDVSWLGRLATPAAPKDEIARVGMDIAFCGYEQEGSPAGTKRKRA
jgi:hypothetical protein